MRDVTDDFIDPYVLTEREVAEIAAACHTLPGDWYVDPNVDHRRTGAPRIWIRPAACNKAVEFSFGISKEDKVFYATIQPHDSRNELPVESIPCGTLNAALTLCLRWLTIALKGMWMYALEVGIRRMCEIADEPEVGALPLAPGRSG